MIDFDPLHKLPKNVRDLGKLIVAKGIKRLPKVQKIAKSGHTGSDSIVLYIICAEWFHYPNPNDVPLPYKSFVFQFNR